MKNLYFSRLFYGNNTCLKDEDSFFSTTLSDDKTLVVPDEIFSFSMTFCGDKTLVPAEIFSFSMACCRAHLCDSTNGCGAWRSHVYTIATKPARRSALNELTKPHFLTLGNFFKRNFN